MNSTLCFTTSKYAIHSPHFWPRIRLFSLLSARTVREWGGRRSLRPRVCPRQPRLRLAARRADERRGAPRSELWLRHAPIRARFHRGFRARRASSSRAAVAAAAASCCCCSDDGERRPSPLLAAERRGYDRFRNSHETHFHLQHLLNSHFPLPSLSEQGSDRHSNTIFY